MGSWSSHLLRSKFPPGAQLGSRAPATPREARKVKLLMSFILVIDGYWSGCVCVAVGYVMIGDFRCVLIY